jgi:pimeloyl-ACP methyl ester carboxylesterase
VTNVHRRGSGDPVVLLHGIGSRWQCFEPVVDRLAEHHEVIGIDLPGFGASPLVDGVRPGPRGYAEWLAGWLVAHDIERPHLVGSSMGGGVALELGRQGLASSVTAFSPVGFWGTAGLRWTQRLLTALTVGALAAGPVLSRAVGHPVGRAVLLSNMFGHPTRIPPDVARSDLVGLAGATGFTAARKDFGRYRLGYDDDPGALVDIPVTIAWGTRDVVLIHRTQSARAREVLPFARHVDLRGCGHLPFHDNASACAGLILEDMAAARPTKEAR